LGAALGVLRWHHALVGKGINKGAAISSSILIRLGGLAAMVGGIIFGVRESLLGRPDEPPGLVTLFLLSEMAAIVALHLLQRGRERYGRKGTLASATALVGLALTVGGYILVDRYEPLGVIPLERLGTLLFLVGLFVAAIGIAGLAMATLQVAIATPDVAVLPWWVWAALMAGNPLLGFLIILVSYGSTSPLGNWLVAVPWIVVGFAVFRAGGLRTEQPSRVR
jgi:hypothetical protein